MSTTTINSTSDATAVSAADKVQSELDVLTARLRRDVWLYGLLAVAAVAVGMLLVAIISDAIFQPESTSLRFVLWSSVLAAGAAATCQFVWCPLQARCNTLALAWSLEEQRPELQEGLTSTLLLADNEQPAAAALVDAVAAQANRNLADCRDDAATRRDMRMPLLAAVSCVVVAAFCFAVWPQYLTPSLLNVMAPWKTRQLPYLTATISPGDIAVAEGEPLEVSALGRDLDGCVLEIMDGDEVLCSTPMTATATGNEAIALLPELTTDQTYRVRSGSLISDDYRITVHPRPVVTAANATLQFPEYTGIEPAIIDELSDPIAAVPGTQVKFSAAANIPNFDTKLTFADRQQPPAKTVQVEDAWWHHWNLRVDEEPVQAGRLELISEHDVSSEPFSFEIRSLPDQSPTVSIKTPTLQQLIVQPDGQLPIQFEAADDFGLQSVELLIQTGEAEPQREVVLQDPAAASHAAAYVFAPQQHDLEVGDQLVLWFVAKDNRTDKYGGAQTAESRQLMIMVTDDAVSVGGQQVIDEQNQIAELLAHAIERLQEAKETALQIADAAQQANANGGKDVPAETNTDAQKLQQQLQDAQKALENAANSNDDAGMFEAEKQQVRNIANEDVEEARQQARMIPLTSDPEQQQQAADAARSAIEQAEERLAALQEQLNDRADKLQQAAELDELARQQNELACQMEEQEQAPQQPEPKQEQIADRLQDLVKQDPDAESEQFRQRADAAEQLAEETNQLQKQQQQLTNATERKTDEETREQLAQMIRKEQQALAAENQQLMEEAQQDEAEPKNEQPAAEAQQLMEQATKDLDEKNLQAAEQNAKSAKEKLQEAAAPNDAADEGTRQQATSKKQDRLAKRQERIADAIRAVDEDNFEAAADELQELITDRLEQVKEDAEELLDLPTDDEENQKTGDEAQQQLQEALKDSKQAATTPQDEQQGDPENKQAAKQNAAEQQNAPQQKAEVGEKQAEQQQQPGQQGEKNGEPQAQQPDDQKNDKAAKQDEADQEQAEQQAQKQQQPGQQEKKDGEPQALQQGDQNNEQAAKQNEAGKKQVEQQQQPNQQEKKNGQPPAQQPQAQQQQQQQQQQAQQKQKQDKAAKSLKKASESLQQFCKSCRKCANCNKPSRSGGSSGNSSPSGNKPASGKQPGGQKQSKKPADGKKSGGTQSGQSGEKKSSSSKQLAKATDNAQKAARKPTAGLAKQLARELDKLADAAAQKSGYSTRKDGKGKSSRDKKGAQQNKAGTDKKKGDQDGSKSPSGEPKGVDGNGEPDDVNTKGTQLRGPSSSEWTRSHKRLRGNVLDSKSTQIPEAYRGVVEDYFEQLSKIEADEEKSGASK